MIIWGCSPSEKKIGELALLSLNVSLILSVVIVVE